MATTAEQAKATIKSAQEAIALGRAATPAGVPQVQKEEAYQVDLRQGLQFEKPKYLAMEV